MSKITLDYDDIVGGTIIFNKVAYEQAKQWGLVSWSQLEDARRYVKSLFDCIEQWQQSGMTLESLENGTKNNNNV